MDGRQPMLDEGQLIEQRYRIVSLLGRGVSGAVYLVLDERASQKHFVLKEVMPVVREGKQGLPFDAAALRRLNHPALPQVYRVFQGEASRGKSAPYYIVMEYVEGSNLEGMRQLMPGKRFSLPTAMTLLSPILDAVGYLHNQQPPLIHADIKPSNIIAPIAGTLASAKLVDFGGLIDSFPVGAGIQGVYPFRAPEQYGKRAGRRTDVYALGAIFYTLLTGEFPVPATDRLACIEAGDPDPLVPMEQYMPSAQVVAQAIHRALSISRHDRFVSVEEFREALWQVMHAGRMTIPASELSLFIPMNKQARPNGSPAGTESLELPVLVPIEEQRELGSESEEPLPERDHATSAEQPSTPMLPQHGTTTSGTSFSFTAARATTPVDGLASSEGTTVLLRKRRRVRSGSYRHGKQADRMRKVDSYSLVVRFLLLTCLLGSAIAIVGYQLYAAKYQSEVTLAQTGIKHLQTAASFIESWAKKPLDTTPVSQAQREFMAASLSFAQLENDVRPYSGIGTSMPGIGSRISTTLHIVSAATKIAQAGITGCDGLTLALSRLHEPFGRGRGLTFADIATIGGDLRQVETDINQASAQINVLQPGDVQFDPHISKAVAAFHRYLPTLQSFLHQSDQLLPLLPSLLGVRSPAFYLVEILDPTEQRPGGGAIKDYGFATFIGGRLSAAHITDVNLLDTQFTAAGHILSLPPAYSWFDPAAQSWNLRDSNLDADFPTAASYAEQNYNHEGGRVPLQGVIAITPTLMAQTLAITGPIRVPELHETVTSQNLLNRIHYYELGPEKKPGSAVVTPQGASSESRYFTELLAQHFLARFHEVRTTALPELFRLLGISLRTKDLQIYFNAAPAENLLRLSHIDAAIPASAGDTFFAVDANLSDNTANQFITSTMDDQVVIDANGNATHRTTMSYAWLRNGELFGPPLYRDYTRIYAPPGSVLQQQQGWQPRGTSQAFGRTVWAGSFTLSQGQTTSFTFVWTAKGVAKKDAAGWHYQYLVQRQAGTSWKLHIQITLPSCASRMHTSGGLLASNGQTATLTQPLAEDATLGVDYHC